MLSLGLRRTLQAVQTSAVVLCKRLRHTKIRQNSGRSKRGLFANRDVMFGNNVSFSENKTRRKFNPNVQRKRLWSVILQSWLKFSVTTRALKCIDKMGGIDEYLMETKDVKLQSVAGQNAKRMIQHRLDQEQKWKDALGV